MEKIKARLGAGWKLVLPEKVRTSLDLAEGEEVTFVLENGKCRLEKEAGAAEPLHREVDIAQIGSYWLPVEIFYYQDGCRVVCQEPPLEARGGTRAEALAKMAVRFDGTAGQ